MGGNQLGINGHIMGCRDLASRFFIRTPAFGKPTGTGHGLYMEFVDVISHTWFTRGRYTEISPIKIMGYIGF